MNTPFSRDDVKILIVEDSPTQAEKLRYILEQHQYDLSVVRNGREALAAIERERPTLVLSDIIMPEMDGYELCRRIKQGETSRRIPVILLTSLTDPTDVVKGLESGADSFIFKPYDEQYLIARIAYTLANQHLRESEYPQMGVEIFFADRKFFITSDRLQILNLLLSTYEAAVQKNRELATTQDELRHLNENLETKVDERTAALEVEIAERRQAQANLQAQLQRLNLLHQITRGIGERQDLQSVYQVVLRSLEDNLAIDFGCVCLCGQNDDSLTVTSVGPRSSLLAASLGLAEETPFPLGDGGVARFLCGELVYEPNITKSRHPFAQHMAESGLHSVVAAPLLMESRVFGVLIAARKQPQSFISGECEFLRQLSEHVALATHQARLYTALQQAYNDLRQTQQAVMQQERLRALGEMASGIAHDINNSISPISLYTESLLEREKGLSDSAREKLKTIQHAIDDVAETVGRMREFYRQREPQLALTRVPMNRLINQVSDLTRARWHDIPMEQGIVIEMKTELAPDLPAIMGVESEIREALTNLIFNAIDAMPNGGTLTLRAYEKAKASNRFVNVEVSDSGIGMDEATRRRCLEPFFTTKGERGTGLGLAMVYGIVQRHGAEIEIDSERGKGATFRLIFAVPETASEPAEDRAPTAIRLDRMRILLVDDDPLITQSLRDALEADGHIVTAADGGQAGIDAFRAAAGNGTPFAAVVTDLGMPHVDGRQVAAAIKEASATTPVILLTGWGQRLVADHETLPFVDRILSKPPKLRELREALAQCCNRT